MIEEAYPDALPAGYRMHWYVLEHVLGQGGFGITYLARDTNLDRRVAIKEYLPSEIARRRSDAGAHPSTEAHAERYHWGLDRFLAEARTLAKFVHPNIVQVHSVFEANNTAYMVMRFEEGENLSRLLERSSMLTERQLLEVLLPILDGLQLVHSAGFIHRDIKPANIYVRQDGTPVLLDFGSARQSFGSSKTMTILVAPGYAPLEQYYSEGATQGAWTDIYGLGATCYRAIAGRAPIDAVVRAKGVLGSAREVLQPAAEAGRGRYSEHLLAAVDHALQLSERDRPQDVASWRDEITRHQATLALPRIATPISAEAAAPRSAVAAPSPASVASVGRAATRWWLAAAGVAAVVGLGAWAYALRAAPRTSQDFVIQPSDAPPVVALPQARSPGPAVLAPAPFPEATPATAEIAAQQVAPPASRTAALPAPAKTAPAAPLPARLVVTDPSPRVRPPAAAIPASAEALTPSPQTTAQAPAVPAPANAATIAPPVNPAFSPPRGPPSSLVVAAAPPSAAAEVPRRAVRNEQIEAADAAFRRGDLAAAAQLLAPWAAAGVTRAQVLLGRVREAASGRMHSDFQAYIWFGIAARAGEPGAQALRDMVAPRLQPAEVQQAEQAIERWRARPEATAAAATSNP